MRLAPQRFKPMPLSSLREPFDDPEWIFELKYDGFRALAYVNGGGAELFSRRDLRYSIDADEGNFLRGLTVPLQ
jgi:bifunctional non-homologous end joining protein LigD